MKKVKKLSFLKFKLIAILTLLIAAGVLSILYAQKQSSIRQIKATKNKSLISLTKNIEGKLLAVTEGEECESQSYGGKCYQMQSAIFLVDYPPDKAYSQLVANLNQHNWTRGGQPVSALTKEQLDQLASNLKSNPDQNAEKSASTISLALLTPSFFGENIFLKKDSSAAYVFVWGDDKQRSENDSLYILRSEIPAVDNFDFNNKVWNPFRESSNKTILVIAASK
jgi:hypothetical protein